MQVTLPIEDPTATTLVTQSVTDHSISSPLSCATNESFLQQLKDQQRNKTLVVFLDYDGTLTPIVERPELAILTPEGRKAISKLSECCLVSIVSGRSRQDVQSKVGLPDLLYAGSHGFDISAPVKTIEKYCGKESLDSLIKQEGTSVEHNHQDLITYQVGGEFIPTLNHLFEELKRQLGDIEGCILENNLFSLSVHYRLIQSEEDLERVRQTVEQLSNEQDGKTKITPGKKVYEIRANYDWNKGKAVMKLLDFCGLNDSQKVFALFLGDDKTDEDAFKYLKENGLGIGILVSPQSSERNVCSSGINTHAKYYLNSPESVKEFLEKLSNYLK